VLSRPGAVEFLEKYEEILDLVLTGYQQEGKRYALVALGCTGGKHRSVSMSQEISRRLADFGYDVATIHRDLGRE
jgi:UPF0042 nucleotide-binding protein